MGSTSTETPFGPSAWRFPDPSDLADGEDFVAAGADLEPATLVEAYRTGYFPMPLDRRSIGWWHPDPRGVIDIVDFAPSRSLRRSCRRYAVTVDRCFEQVMHRCADPRRSGAWIDRRIRDAYTELHRLDVAHSVEVWDDDALVGGLYGVAVGGLFAGESMFHHATDASKVALVALVEILRSAGSTERRLLDVQWCTDHLSSLGARAIPRNDYLDRLERAAPLDPPGFREPADPPPDPPSPTDGDLS